MVRALARVVLITLVAAAGLVGPLTAPAAAVSSSTYESDVTRYSNAERTKRHLAKLANSSCVNRYAEAQATRMARSKRLYHQDMMTVLRACQLRAVGENVAVGYPSGKSVTAAWMASPGHRANLLRSGYRLIGVGAVKGSDGRWYVSQVFGQAR